MVYSGLSKTIGKPRDLEKNVEDKGYFDSDLNISIPIEETKQFKKA